VVLHCGVRSHQLAQQFRKLDEVKLQFIDTCQELGGWRSPAFGRRECGEQQHLKVQIGRTDAGLNVVL
jgi:hypothetical protein